MAYRPDPDLAFLEEVPSEDLDNLVEVLTKDREGVGRLTEELTQSEEYRRHSPDHHQYWELIAAEIQCFGANTLATMFRGGEGVLYKEMLQDVCDKMDVNYRRNAEVQSMEMNLLMKVLENSMREMSRSELKKVCKDLDLKTTNYTAEATLIALQIAIRKSGFEAYKIAVIVANAVVKALIGRGLSVAANAALTRLMSIFAGPIGWIFTAGWALIDIAGPAYRITIPTAIMVAHLRLAVQTGNLGKSEGEDSTDVLSLEYAGGAGKGKKARKKKRRKKETVVDEERLKAAEARCEAAEAKQEAANAKVKKSEAKRDAARTKLEAAKEGSSLADLKTARAAFEVAQAKLEAAEARHEAAITENWAAVAAYAGVARDKVDRDVEEMKEKWDDLDRFMAQDGFRQLEDMFGKFDKPSDSTALDDDDEDLFPPDSPAKKALEVKYDAASKKANKVGRKLSSVKADPDATQADIDVAQAKYKAAAKKRDKARTKWADTP